MDCCFLRHTPSLKQDSPGWVESNRPQGVYYLLEPILVVKGVEGTKATAFKEVGSVTIGDLRLLAKDPEKRMRVVSLAKGIGTKTMNKLLEETDITQTGKPSLVKNHLLAENY